MWEKYEKQEKKKRGWKEGGSESYFIANLEAWIVYLEHQKIYSGKQLRTVDTHLLVPDTSL